jgi:hypothetical protein
VEIHGNSFSWRDSTRHKSGKNNALRIWDIFYTIILFTRDDPPGNMDAKDGEQGREVTRVATMETA